VETDTLLLGPVGVTGLSRLLSGMDAETIALYDLLRLDAGRTVKGLPHEALAQICVDLRRVTQP
jgi:hypothetical protein